MDPVKVWSSDAASERERESPQNCPVRGVEGSETGLFVWEKILLSSLFIFVL